MLQRGKLPALNFYCHVFNEFFKGLLKSNIFCISAGRVLKQSESLMRTNNQDTRKTAIPAELVKTIACDYCD